MRDDEHQPQHNEFLPALPCHARLVLALESAVLSHRRNSERLTSVVDDCVADLRSQGLDEQQIIATMTELVSDITSAAWARSAEEDSAALTAEVAACSAAACRRLSS